MDIIDRISARDLGLEFYFTGKPCKHGHVSVRRVSNWQCDQCNKEYYEENKNRINKRAMLWQENNKEKEAKRRKDWYEKNKDKKSKYVREWTSQNRDRKASAEANRRARIKNAEGTHTADDVALILEEQNFTCPYCDADLAEGYHVDHYVPLSLGGSNWPDNLQCLCPTCNISKGAKRPSDWHKSLWVFIKCPTSPT